MEFVMDMEGVQAVRSGTPTEDLSPGVIHASIPHTNILITLAMGAAGGIGGGIASEDGKEIYKGAKEYILSRLEDWKQARFSEVRRQWIELAFDLNDELVNRWKH